ncbi:MAG: tetrathionate reductase family octaheme c-type cytochrome [Phycisphaerae bacterium]|nr:tetrathionate reductase family octaheme c-type cytochrome [Phycisphaerae bacterium]
MAIGSNEGRCTQCHIGIGWKDNSFDFNNASGLDCLVCHDQSGQYKKAATTAGGPDESVDLQLAAKSVAQPTRANCGVCHFYAGGGDNVKHGDLASSLIEPTSEMDVHMGSIATGGHDFNCQACHTTANHLIAGTTALHSDEGVASCANCHGTGNVHTDATLNLHVARVACQSCHIPTFARQKPTKVEWYWNEAGQDIDPIPTDEFGMETYDKKKGRFVWGKDVEPELRWFNGKYDRMIVGVNDQYTQTPVVLAEPVGDINDLDAKLYPFKKLIGKQAADANNHTVLVPHLFGTASGENPYWSKFDWDLALQEGAAYTGQTYSGQYEWVDTVMYLSVNHEVAPKEQARACNDCHGGGIDFVALGYEADPLGGGGNGGDETDGATLLADYCSACHGADGSGPPNVNGSTAAEIQAKIDAGGVHAGAAGLTETQVAAIATFLGG